MTERHPKIAFIGFGEAAEAFAKGWGADISSGLMAYDEKVEQAGAAGKPAERAMATGIVLASDRASVLDGADVVFCLVTADRAVLAAEQAAPYLKAGAFWLDGNSCSPGAKRRSADIISSAGGRYVDVAIMAPVYPKLHRTPLLLAGPHADPALAVLTSLGMEARVSGPEVGEASSIKMIRSVMIKGMEALTAECLLAARRAGIEERVLASLQSSNPNIDWPRQAAYNLERMMVHGRRRAAEMREVAITLSELGLPNGLASATADWQQRIGDLILPAGDENYPERADAILSRLKD
ncbi:NAD(P)-dependent oxidoreductase [Rhizobium sp. RM]|uniref:NAD(P)-dependent oxidoreductase n=1 Tax=Rhizobium sp. RM TaxID=2748079 RepID=UPI00110EEC8A|nr:NAD(P)-dependent oxidoreductase [Rhizobium sp. RM]NWJ25305.1 NAD(P)-dependent oxidoreductase [Rhizobium sp. RM]TMV17606.1 NAD(P)-dependent oxidoreductase [Rhizobium sp. Td3]